MNEVTSVNFGGPEKTGFCSGAHGEEFSASHVAFELLTATFCGPFVF